MDKILAELERMLQNQGVALPSGVTLDQITKSLVSSSSPGLSAGLFPYNLDPVAKLLLPERTPLQNGDWYAVSTGETGDRKRYKAIVGQNTNRYSGSASEKGVGTGRGSKIGFQFLPERAAIFGKLAPESEITWELFQQSGPMGALAKQTIASLIAAKEMEERMILGGNKTALTAPTVTAAGSSSGGSYGAVTVTATVVPLNYYAWWYYNEVSGNLAAFAAALAATLAGRIDGAGPKGTATGVVFGSGSTNKVTLSWTHTPGAWGYAVLANDGSNIDVIGFTTECRYTLTAQSGTHITALPTVDGSLLDVAGNTLAWGGMVDQMLDTDIPSYYKALRSTLTATATGSGVLQLEDYFSTVWARHKLSPELLVMGPQTFSALGAIAMGLTSPTYRINLDGTKADEKVVAGTILGAVKNQFAQKAVQVMAHPLCHEGKILGYLKAIDYPEAGVGANLTLHTSVRYQQDFFARTEDVAPPGPWAIKTYGSPVLYFPGPCGLIEGVYLS